jgi:hypothetical protein
MEQTTTYFFSVGFPVPSVAQHTAGYQYMRLPVSIFVCQRLPLQNQTSLSIVPAAELLCPKAKSLLHSHVPSVLSRQMMRWLV